MNAEWLSVALLILPVFVVLLEWGIGFTGHLNPLYYYQHIAIFIAKRVNRLENGVSQQQLAGLLAMLLLVGVPLAAYWGLSVLADIPLLLEATLLFLLLGWRTIMHDMNLVMNELTSRQSTKARLRLSHWVLRDTHQLEQQQMVSAASESLVLNLAQGWFGVLFWYALLGPYAALCYRLIEQLHWSWNPKLARYQAFGLRASQCHQLLSYLPKQIVGLLMCLFGRVGHNFTLRRQGFRWPQTSSGQLIGITASWLASELGGQRHYEGLPASYPLFGPRRKPPLVSDFRVLRLRCYLTACNYLIFIIYPLLIVRYVISGI
ncbi:cobalamin biosynthesis protein [Celerinatantimonas sp. YJH-8]|uniref:cobalamin biosynthesis protein CobD/CbiB n=1 Tax=Celerinatantimonas sp. YJH-8 TaxID=3228714 RepID=UPI0038C26067